MTRIEQVKHVDELIKKWRRLEALAGDNVKFDSETLLQLFLTCLKRGAVFLVYSDKGLCGSACVEWRGNGNLLVLHSLPTDQGNGFGKHCLESIKSWAKDQGADRIEVTSNKLSGSNFRYFEKTLGFRRQSVNFAMKL